MMSGVVVWFSTAYTTIVLLMVPFNILTPVTMTAMFGLFIYVWLWLTSIRYFLAERNPQGLVALLLLFSTLAFLENAVSGIIALDQKPIIVDLTPLTVQAKSVILMVVGLSAVFMYAACRAIFEMT